MNDIVSRSCEPRTCYDAEVYQVITFTMNNVVVGILVVVVIAIVGWIAYSQGYFDRAQQEDANGLNIEIGGSNDAQ